MTQRERIMAVLSHQLPDRMPAIIDARQEVQQELMRYYGVDAFEDALRILGAENMYRFPTDSMLKVDFPGYDEKAEVVEGPWMGGGKKYIKIDERTLQDEWGVVRQIGSDGKFVEWRSGPLEDADDPDEYDFPDPERIIDDPDLPANVAAWKEHGFFVRALVSQPYKTAWVLRGMQNLLMDYLTNLPFVEKLYDKIYALQTEILRRCTAAGVDMIGFDGDIAMHDRLIMGPRNWRKVDKPRLAAVVQSCKAINPNVHVFIHSDGDISKILPDLIEIGFDVIDPMQPECMDHVEIKKKYGDQITMHRGGSLQRTLPFGTPEDCRQEAIQLIENCGYNGGLLPGASNTVSFDVPIENLVAWYEAVRDYDMSTLQP